MSNPRQTFQTYAHTLFNPTASPQQQREAVQALHALFVSLGAINALETPDSLPDHLQLSSGRAIAPRQAGLCLLEVMRTKTFAAGLRDAIGDLLRQFPGKTIRVLDAGCGPYALLPLLAAFSYTPQQVRFTLLDIFEPNLESARTLIAQLDMAAYCDAYLQADATTYQWPDCEGPDIVISETMNKGLEKEPQVAITLNLAAQLPPHGILLPEAVSVSLCCIHARQQQQALQLLDERIPGHYFFENELGKVVRLDKQTTYESITQNPLCSIAIPAVYNAMAYKLQLCTVIRVYKHHLLQRSDCSLTLPLNLEPVGKTTVAAGDTLDLYYVLGTEPGIAFRTRQPGTCVRRN